LAKTPSDVSVEKAKSESRKKKRPSRFWKPAMSLVMPE
jgi:hypothetical protein